MSKSFNRQTILQWLKKVTDIMKVLTMHRKLGANEESVKLWGATAPRSLVAPSLVIRGETRIAQF